MLQEAPEPEPAPEDPDVLTEVQKKELGELQLFKNKEGDVSIEVGVHGSKGALFALVEAPLRYVLTYWLPDFMQFIKMIPF